MSARKPRPGQARDLVQIAAAVVGSAAAAQVVNAGPPYSEKHDQILDEIERVLRDQLGVEPDGTQNTIDYEDVHQASYAITAAVLPLMQRHDSDCQSAQHTYVHQGEPGIYPHGNRDGRHFAVDAVGTNGRRLLVRDDPDGVYLGGAMFTDDDALKLAAHLELMVARRKARS